MVSFEHVYIAVMNNELASICTDLIDQFYIPAPQSSKALAGIMHRRPAPRGWGCWHSRTAVLKAQSRDPLPLVVVITLSTVTPSGASTQRSSGTNRKSNSRVLPVWHSWPEQPSCQILLSAPCIAGLRLKWLLLYEYMSRRVIVVKPLGICAQAFKYFLH